MRLNRGQVLVAVISIILAAIILFLACTIGEKQDINVLTDNQLRQELLDIRGIGEVIADRVVNYRAENKPVSIAELDAIKGIGDKRLSLIKKKFKN